MVPLRLLLTPALLGLAPALWATHPLVCEDSGTLGTGHLQVETAWEGSRGFGEAGQPARESGQLTLTGGLSPALDAAVALAYERSWDEAEPGAVPERGLADPVLALKWRFAEHGPLSLAFKPSLEIGAGETGSLPPGTGPALGVALVASAAVAPVVLHANLLWQQVVPSGPDLRRETWGACAAGILSLPAGLSLALEGGWQQDEGLESDSQTFFGAGGLIWSLNSLCDLDAGWRYTADGAAFERTLLAGCTLHL